MSKTPQYGENGFVPTVVGHTFEGSALYLETLDPRTETDLVSLDDEPINRVANMATDEQKEVLALYERN